MYLLQPVDHEVAVGVGDAGAAALSNGARRSAMRWPLSMKALTHPSRARLSSPYGGYSMGLSPWS
jgi:hypothetical protein